MISKFCDFQNKGKRIDLDVTFLLREPVRLGLDSEIEVKICHIKRGLFLCVHFFPESAWPSVINLKYRDYFPFIIRKW